VHGRDDRSVDYVAMQGGVFQEAVPKTTQAGDDDGLRAP